MSVVTLSHPGDQTVAMTTRLKKKTLSLLTRLDSISTFHLGLTT